MQFQEKSNTIQYINIHEGGLDNGIEQCDNVYWLGLAWLGLAYGSIVVGHYLVESFFINFILKFLPKKGALRPIFGFLFFRGKEAVLREEFLRLKRLVSAIII